MLKKIVKRLHIIIKNKSRHFLNKLFGASRRKRLTNTDFTIICNNCWGGSVYQYFDLPYNSPTIGLYFYASDFIKFISNLHYYTSCTLEFITAEDSRYYDELKGKHQLKVPIAKLDDIEIIFLHYDTEQEAREKWERRVKRINFSNLIIKFSQMNLWKDEDLKNFENLSYYKKKFFFCHTQQYKNAYKSAVYFKGYEQGDGVKNDTDLFDSYINLFDMINSNVFPQI